MALFTDGTIASIDDLKEYESAVLQVASVEGIDITAKLKLAQREMGFVLSDFQARRGFTSPSDLGRVLVNEEMLQWHCLHTLELVYRDAYNSQMNDRYLGKWQAYQQSSARAAATVRDLGVGMVGTPVAKATEPIITTDPGGGLAARTYYVSVAWRALNGATGERSDPTVVAAPMSTLLRITAASAPAHASGWYVYAGSSETEIRRQNEPPLAPGSTWVEPNNGLRFDLTDIPAQRPDWYVRNDRVLLRG
jgi:hypothetical protein